MERYRNRPTVFSGDEINPSLEYILLEDFNIIIDDIETHVRSIDDNMNDVHNLGDAADEIEELRRTLY